MQRFVFIIMFLCVAAVIATASEDCSKLGGRCRPSCDAGEEMEAGAFEDCPEQDQCCVPRSRSGSAANCCVRSFDARMFGPGNCDPPAHNACAQGSASPVPCDKLAMCRK